MDNTNEVQEIINQAITTIQQVATDAIKALGNIAPAPTIAPIPKKVEDSYNSEDGSAYYIIDCNGRIQDDCFGGYTYDRMRAESHRCFKNKEMAELYLKKNQPLLDMMYFKECYDINYKPDLNDMAETKYSILFDVDLSKFITCTSNSFYYPSIVFFSSEEIAAKCADWMNDRLSCKKSSKMYNFSPRNVQEIFRHKMYKSVRNGFAVRQAV
ncbi:MAG: hypothetical protein Q4F95_02360 [Oscillospiraceae bacterium]|nr:hypothetical protein [Oscillospiraceae bacterium]